MVIEFAVRSRAERREQRSRLIDHALNARAGALFQFLHRALRGTERLPHGEPDVGHTCRPRQDRRGTREMPVALPVLIGPLEFPSDGRIQPRYRVSEPQLGARQPSPTRYCGRGEAAHSSR